MTEFVLAIIGALVMISLVLFFFVRHYRKKVIELTDNLNAVVDTNHALMEQIAKMQMEKTILEENRYACEKAIADLCAGRVSPDDVLPKPDGGA